MPKAVKKQRRVNWFFVGVVALMLLLVCASRLPGLMHGAEFHPDEYVFYATVNAVIEGDFSFQTVKAYSNGAFVYQLPVYLLAQVYNAVIGWVFWLTPIIIGRLSSVFYFCLGSVLGAFLCWRVFGRDKKALLFYAAIIVFSLFHLEQSRYGTGDAITFFVLMLVLWLCWMQQQSGRWWQLALAGFFVGSLAAIKLPQVLALALPLGVLLFGRVHPYKAKSTGQKIALPLMCLGCFVLGLVVFTPALFSDPGFFANMLRAEGSGYFTLVNEHGAGNVLNHFFGILVYQLLFADVPLAPVLAGLGVWVLNRDAAQKDEVLFRRVVPVFMAAFLLMNIVVSTLFLRALYPFFCLCNLYAAFALGRLAKKKSAPAVVAVALCGVMTVRGVLFAADLAGPSESEKARAILEDHPQWDERSLSVVYGNYFVPHDIPERTYYYPFNAVNEAEERQAMLQPGEFFVSGAIDIEVRKRPFHAPVSDAFEQRIAGWQAFRQENVTDYVGQSLPAWKYWLYGGWVHGSTLAAYEFPPFYVYYRADDAPAEDAARREQYQNLYTVTEPDAFFAALQQMDDIALVAVGQGDATGAWPLLWQGLGMEKAPVALAPGQSLVGVVDFDTGKTVFEVSDAPQVLDALSMAGFDCVLESDGTIREPVPWTEERMSRIVVSGRDYSLGLDGINLAVYDKARGCVREWVTIRRLAGADAPEILRQRP